MTDMNLLLAQIRVKEAELDTFLEANDIVKADDLSKELEGLTSQVKAHNDNAQKLADIKRSKAARADFMEKPTGVNLPGGASSVSAGRVEAGDSSLDKQKSLAHFYQLVGLTGDTKNFRQMQNSIETLENLYGAPSNKDFMETWEKSNKNAPLHLKAALAESAGVTGGYTVPPEYSDKLFAFDIEDGVLAGKTDEYPLSGRELVFPVLDQTQTLAVGQSNFLGGIIAYWGAEAQLRTETEPKFRELRLAANELSGLAYASRNVLMDNVVALERFLNKSFGKAILWYKDYAYLQGNGVDKPKGVLNEAATISVTRQTSNKITYQDIAQMYGKLMPQSVKRAFWVMQQSAIQSMLQMVDTAGNLIIQPYFPGGAGGGPAAVRPVMMMLGIPIITTEKTPALGTKGDLMLIDPMGYCTATRQDVEIGASEHYKFANNQMTYRFLFRGDGRSWLNAPITLADQSTQISPFVALN